MSSQNLLRGLSVRCLVTDCRLGSFKVIVKACSGSGDCASVCIVNVFELNERGECTVKNSDLCFGCTACLSQCTDNGVEVIPNEGGEYPDLDELLR
ncbi:MAG TPA: hypothetical protein VFF30_10010 [Nitrososphaerales archaeon]|nr:hypothetical protein [Nitrososphaerales archaeon]